MSTWKVWFSNSTHAKVCMEFKGDYSSVSDLAVVIANRLGLIFDYEMEEREK